MNCSDNNCIENTTLCLQSVSYLLNLTAQGERVNIISMIKSETGNEFLPRQVPTQSGCLVCFYSC